MSDGEQPPQRRDDAAETPKPAVPRDQELAQIRRRLFRVVNGEPT